MNNRKILSLAIAATPLAIHASSKPNIIFFLVDDYGWPQSQVEYDGNSYPIQQNFKTPNMQRLANMGVKFSRAYACPVSSPTRTSLMSGMNAAHTHITNWTSFHKDEYSDANPGGAYQDKYMGCEEFKRPEWNINGLCPVSYRKDSARLKLGKMQFATPLVQLLSDDGYYTVHVGKAHWSTESSPGANPYNFGFNINIGGTPAGKPRSYLSEDNYGNIAGKWDNYAVPDLTQYYGSGLFLTEALTQEALKALRYPIDHKQPFYLYMSHYAVHLPAMADQRFYDNYTAKGLDAGQSKFSSMVEGVDKSLGDIMDFLEKEKIANNTIIIFYSDNGGNSISGQLGGKKHTQNAPLREGKGSCYEGGIRVPMSIYWPGKTKAGSTIDYPTAPEDLFHTVLEMANIKHPMVYQDTDGESLVPLITKGTGIKRERPIVFHYPHQWKPNVIDEIDFLSTVICGDWKLVYRMKTGARELYNLKDDIREKHDLSAKFPEKVVELSKQLGNKLRQWKATMPVYSQTGKPVPMPDEL